MNKRTVSLLIVVLMILSAIPVALPVTLVSAGNTSTPQTLTLITKEESPFTPALEKAIQMQLALGKKEIRFIVAPKDGYEWDVYNELKKIGIVDPMSKPQYKFIVVTVPKSNINKLKEVKGIMKIWLDKKVTLPKPDKEKLDELLNAPTPVEPQMFMSIFTIGAYNAWMDYGVYGNNVTVAVLDTGVDPLHPFLQVTLDGKRKIIDWKDFTDEGYVSTVYYSNKTSDGVLIVNQTVDGVYIDNVTIGGITSASGEYHFGLLHEEYFDLDFNENTSWHFVLFVDSSNAGWYDTVYIDTDNDLNLTDETPIHLFSETGDVAVFNTSKVGVVLADYDPSGTYVVLGWDGHGHGTHVAGTIAGVGLPDDPVFAGVYGVAPNAQIIAVRVLVSWGFGYMSWIIDGMIYASIYGPDWMPFSGDEADVISMSLGGLAEYNDGTESPENFYVNYLTELTGVTFVIAAGNEGPGLNTVGSPGNSDYAITVGAMWEGERLDLLSGGLYSGVPDSVVLFSSRGPRMDGRLDPDVVAPGVWIFSSVPVWYTVAYDDPYYYYDYWSGTSMATPHVSGAVALMISYAKSHGIDYNPFKIRKALMQSAKKLEYDTMVDQGFGLIQVNKAIEELEKMASESTVEIYAGTTFTTFKDALGKDKIPTVPLYDYISNVYGLPYLFKGVYARNELPSGVPIYVYALKYNETSGYMQIINGTYKLSTNVDWIELSTDEITVTEDGAIFYITIDYSKIQQPGVYDGIIYIDDPNTEQLEGYVPVILIVPFNSNEFEGQISDSEKPGQSKHYFFDVPEGTQMLEITLTVPVDENGNPLGRTWIDVLAPTGRWEDWSGYVGAGADNNTVTLYIQNPEPGTWEMAAYSSIALSYYGLNMSMYTISVKVYSVNMDPSFIRKDVDKPGVVGVKATATNAFEDFNASIIGVGVGRTDTAYAWVENVSQDEWKLVDIIDASSLSGVYYFKVGITQPEVPEADLDLYIDYYDEDWNYVTTYWQQIGPTSEESFELFMPQPGYYVVWVYGYDTAGYNPVHFIYYRQVLTDNGSVSVDTTPFIFKKGETKEISATVNLTDNGTYLGVLGIADADSGTVLTYAPMILQVGQPEMFVALYGEPVLGEPTMLTLKILDKATLKPIEGEVQVVINGKTYYAENGELKFYYTATSLKDRVFDIKVISAQYKDFNGKFTLPVKEPISKVATESDISASVVLGNGALMAFEKSHGRVTVTVDGKTGETSMIMLVLPKDAQNIRINGDTDHILDYYIETGKYAQYLIITVQFASSVTIEVSYLTAIDVINQMTFVWYMMYRRYLQKFDELYNKSIELGIDNETIQEALHYKQLAEQYYEEASSFGSPLTNPIKALAPIRKAYLNIMKAVETLSKAIEEAESS
ncbi:MAG: S8 family serine peptidase [Thermococcus sp.]|uniref:S8 family serine peptidase n=1 Tax=Thermococcus sp. TaxID=35749 RepID=UPI001D8FAAC8|nr:S8 family serine peptidase [Thermococcus sp.]MBO8174681.1 S8 family serine peptidase [Thermococcus sp.]